MTLFLSATQMQGDPVALCMVLGLALFVAVMPLRKYLAQKKPAPTQTPQPMIPDTPAPVIQRPKAPGSAGKLKLYNVEPKTAAMIMAITADKMGKPLNELHFISIKEVTNQ